METLKLLQAHGLTLAVVANWDCGLGDHLAALGLDKLFATVVTSAEAGVPKPDPGPFLLALGRLGVGSGRALHVGDEPADEMACSSRPALRPGPAHSGLRGLELMSGRLVAWLALTGALTLLNYASRASSGKPPKDIVYHYSLAVGGLIQYGLILGLVLLIAEPGRRSEVLALRRPTSWGRALGLMLVVLVGVYILSAVLAPLLHPGREQGLTPSGWDSSRAGAFAASFVVLAVVGPIVEELQFRGLGYSLLAGYGSTVAIVVIGLTFGLVHGLVEGLPVLVAFGAGLAWLRSRTNSVYPCMALHIAFNSIALAVSVLA